MKNLKLITVLCLSLCLNCSSNDDDNTTNVNDPIVGKWYLKYQKIGSTIINDTDCHQQSYIQWNSDLTAKRDVYINDGQGGDCQLYSSDTGTWEVITDNEFNDDNYRFIGANQSVDEEIIFVDDNNIIIDYGFSDFYYEKSN